MAEEEGIVSDFDEPQEIDTEGIEHIYPLPPAPYLDEKAIVLAGWPGHRTRPGRCGYDPLDTDFELAHVQGIIVRLLLNGNLRTKNPFYLIGMIFTGILFSGSILPAIGYPNQALNSRLEWLLWSCPYWAIGFSLLINIVRSLIDKETGSDADEGKAFY